MDVVLWYKKNALMDIRSLTLDDAYWHSKWNTMEIGFDQPQPNAHLMAYFSHLPLKKGAKVFVPLCGKSIDMHWLLQQEFQIIGNDLSLKACQCFLNTHQIPYDQTSHGVFIEYQAHFQRLRLLAGDFFRLTPKLIGPIDGIYDRAALVALPAPLRRRYAKKIIEFSHAPCHYFLISLTYPSLMFEGPPFSVSENEIHSLFQEAFTIHKIGQQKIHQVPEHLKKRGLMHLQECVYHLSSKS